MTAQPQPLAPEPIGTSTRRWLGHAAQQLGVPTELTAEFSQNGTLNMPGVMLHLSQWQAEPVAQWIALALLPRPADCSPALWNELLLRSNCTVSAMCTGSVALSDGGDALLAVRLDSRPDSHNPPLSDELSLLLALAESLMAAATALSAGSHRASTPTAVSATTDPLTTVAATDALKRQWHRPRLSRALQRLGLATPALTDLNTVGVIQTRTRAFEVIADGDEQHLLVSTRLATLLNTPAQREHALRANLPLLLLSQCAVVLAPEGAALQARWNSQGLEGDAFADWLLDFGQLADSFTPSLSSTASAPRNPAWT